MEIQANSALFKGFSSILQIFSTKIVNAITKKSKNNVTSTDNDILYVIVTLKNMI